jgi:glycosyltransferase involved in cell wall biosynthesis
VRILLVSPRYLPFIGGQERQVHELRRHLNHAGHLTDVMTENFSNYSSKQESLEGSTIHRMGTKGIRLVALVKFLFFFLRNLQFYDLVIARTFSVHSLALAIAGFLVSNRPVLILMMDAETELKRLGHPLIKELALWAFSKLDLISAPSSKLYSELQDFGFSLDHTKLIPNGVNTDKAASVIEVTKPVKSFVYMGNIAASKGVFDLLDAYSEVSISHPEISLTFIGSGHDLNLIRDLVRDSSIGGVAFLDFVPFDQVSPTLERFDCLVLPSHTEGFGLLAFEAAMTPIEIICSDVADLNSYLAKRASFYKPGDVRTLFNKMLEKLEFKDKRVYSNESWMRELCFQSLISTLFVEYQKARDRGNN